jgi:hypothetical protein
VQISGTITPPKGGVKVWIVREEMANTTGTFHPAARPALTNEAGEWTQWTNLWGPGPFRIHAFVTTAVNERLLAYYREAFEAMRTLYRQEVDPASPTVPSWPLLNDLPEERIGDREDVNF